MLAESSQKQPARLSAPNFSSRTFPSTLPSPYSNFYRLTISSAEAKRVLKSQSEIDPSEQQYLLEYYSLVKEGKTNYISTTAFHDVTGEHPTEPENFFKIYEGEMRPKKKAKHENK